jgi:hypothetical protein
MNNLLTFLVANVFYNECKLGPLIVAYKIIPTMQVVICIGAN